MHPFVNLYENLIKLCESGDSFYFSTAYKDGVEYRIFNYRLASYSEFQKESATECRGHTFRNDGGEWKLASLPSAKFFNYSEHIGWGDAIDVSNTTMIMDKADGSLISTVIDHKGNVFLKSKGSFTSSQAVEASAYVFNDNDFWNNINFAVKELNYTVNFELVGPQNQIVLGYAVEQLIVLNARNMVTGEYAPYNELKKLFGKNVITTYDIPNDMIKFLNDVETTTEKIEGVVFVCDGKMYKHKTSRYITLHRLKDSVNNERRLWEACISETSDDLRALFVDDPLTVAKIIDMEEKAAKVFNHADKVVREFYNENKDLDRKSYAIKGQEALNADGLFSIAMNLYLGKDANLKEFLVKNYKKYGVKDEENVSE